MKDELVFATMRNNIRVARLAAAAVLAPVSLRGSAKRFLSKDIGPTAATRALAASLSGEALTQSLDQVSVQFGPRVPDEFPPPGTILLVLTEDSLGCRGSVQVTSCL